MLYFDHMEGGGSKEAVKERLGISLSREQSEEFYHALCSFLVAKDAHAYVKLLRTKYELLKCGVSLRKCDYMIMEILLEKIETEHPLILASTSYVVKYKS